MKPFSFQHKLGRVLLSWIQHYNHEKYWKRRDIVINPNDKTYLLLKLYYLYYIKRTDAYHNCSFGTNLNSGAYFATPPHLPHGPKGIIVGHDVRIGANSIIYQQVTKTKIEEQKKEQTSVSSFECSAKGNRTPVLRMRILRPNP